MHLQSPSSTASTTMPSFFRGLSEPPLLALNFAQLLDKQALDFKNRPAIASVWQETRWTYESLRRESRCLAQKLLEHGVCPGDNVMVLAGNCIEYVQLFFATTAIGAVFVVISVTFTAEEVVKAVEFVDPRAIFIAPRIGYRANDTLIRTLASKAAASTDPSRRPYELICFQDETSEFGANLTSFRSFLKAEGKGEVGLNSIDTLDGHWGKSSPSDVCCFQFTSGTTGMRKVSMLSHCNLINNGFFVGERLGFSSEDVLCCPPPLFHCFGLVCGLIAAVTHGSALILPSEVFNPALVLQSLSAERCTALHAVPTMFDAIVNHQRSQKVRGSYSLRTGIIAGATLSGELLQRLNDHLGLSGLLYAFGMTELSAVSFMTSFEHSLLLDRSTVGSLMPHTAAKVIDAAGNTLPQGIQGELCVSGYLLHQGYYRDPKLSAETVQQDEEGLEWLHTGDLGIINRDGLCTVIGRTKDLIKKGGDNIIPKDIEEALLSHTSISNAAVVGIDDEKWGEVVGVFIQQSSEGPRLTNKDLKTLLRKHNIAPHKMPDHFFRMGEGEGVPDRLPINLSGKIMKADLRSLARDLVKKNSSYPNLANRTVGSVNI